MSTNLTNDGSSAVITTERFREGQKEAVSAIARNCAPNKELIQSQVDRCVAEMNEHMGEFFAGMKYEFQMRGKW